MLDLIAQIGKDFARLDRRVVFALTYAAAALTAISFLKNPWYLQKLLASTPWAAIGDEAVNPTSSNIYALLWWVAVSMFFYFVIPALVVKYLQRRPLTEIGLAHRIEPGFGKLLAACLAIMLPLTYLMSLTGSFAAKYPFLQIYDGGPYLTSTLLVWELAYALQFFGLEFFFRGFMVHSLKPQLGLYSIFAMTVPYTMIHLQKPMAEAYAAVIAGIFLGWISYRNGTIWLGLVLHCSVALSMDVFSIMGKN